MVNNLYNGVESIHAPFPALFYDFKLKIHIVKPGALYHVLQRRDTARMQGVACHIYIEFLLQSIALSSAPSPIVPSPSRYYIAHVSVLCISLLVLLTNFYPVFTFLLDNPGPRYDLVQWEDGDSNPGSVLTLFFIGSSTVLCSHITPRKTTISHSRSIFT